MTILKFWEDSGCTSVNIIDAVFLHLQTEMKKRYVCQKVD